MNNCEPEDVEHWDFSLGLDLRGVVDNDVYCKKLRARFKEVAGRVMIKAS